MYLCSKITRKVKSYINIIYMLVWTVNNRSSVQNVLIRTDKADNFGSDAACNLSRSVSGLVSVKSWLQFLTFSSSSLSSVTDTSLLQPRRAGTTDAPPPTSAANPSSASSSPPLRPAWERPGPSWCHRRHDRGRKGLWERSEERGGQGEERRPHQIPAAAPALQTPPLPVSHLQLSHRRAAEGEGGLRLRLIPPPQTKEPLRRRPRHGLNTQRREPTNRFSNDPKLWLY